MKKTAVQSFLQDVGLVCHTFVCNQLPANILFKLTANGEINVDDKYLSLIANAGPTFWKHLQAHYKEQGCAINADSDTDWFDQRSIEIMQDLLNLAGIKSEAAVLYPASTAAPLIPLGELAGWSSESPLGLGVSERYGPWFAYRGLLLTHEPLTDDELPKQQHSPCIECDAPCVTACPAGAVDKDATFNISLCADYRVQQTEPNCKTQCHARNACPVGTQYRYPKEQRAYHMTRAMNAIVAWAEKS